GRSNLRRYQVSIDFGSLGGASPLSAIFCHPLSSRRTLHHFSDRPAELSANSRVEFTSELSASGSKLTPWQSPPAPASFLTMIAMLFLPACSALATSKV